MKRPLVGTRLRIAHLIPGALAQHSPTSGIAAQIRHHDPARVASEVLSFYPAPTGRSPAAMFAALGAEYEVLAARRDPLDSHVFMPLVRHLRRTRPDVLHCHFVRANIYGRIAARLAGVPVVINTLRGIDDYTSDATLSSRIVRLTERRTLALVSCYVTVSDAVRRHAIDTLGIPPARIVTILNALDLDPFERPPTDRGDTRRDLGIEPDAVVLASVGNLIPLKNHRLAIRMVGKLRERSRTKVQLLIIGEGPDHEQLDHLIRDLGLADAVQLLGLRRDVPRVLRAVDVFVMLSQAEGLPRAAMEAMASGLPCVTSDRGGIPEAMVDGTTGYMRALEDEPGILNALTRLVEDAATRSRMGSDARRLAFQRFSPKRLAGEYEALYDSLRAERPAGVLGLPRATNIGQAR